MLTSKRTLKIISPFYLSIVLLISLTVYACSSANATFQPGPLSDSDAQALADPIVENMLRAINAADYALYTHDFDEEFKRSQCPEAFETLGKRIEAVGKYLSKSYGEMVQKNDRIMIAYRANFEKESVTVSVFLKNVTGKWYVDGTYYDSPQISFIEN